MRRSLRESDMSRALARWAALAFAAVLLCGTRASAQAPPAPGSVFRDCPDCPEMVVIPAGQFRMGSPDRAGNDNEHPEHDVTVGKSFALGRFPITRHEFAQFVRATGYHVSTDWFDAGFDQSDRDPVVEIGWLDAQAYVYWLSRRTHQDYRLPSEAEWEYAARGGRQTEFWWGDDSNQAPAFANFAGVDDGFSNTAPVDSFKPNQFGLFDMAGNVWQWVADCYNGDYRGAPADGTSWLTGDCSSRVVRGGSWYDPRSALRAANRTHNHISDHDSNVGFRIARTLAP
jgi:formylglycine-generating enzyme required for sulfatase activity